MRPYRGANAILSTDRSRVGFCFRAKASDPIQGLKEIETTLEELCKSKKAPVDWDIKYGTTSRGGHTMKNEDGSFTFVMDLPIPEIRWS
jgi:hypothetical protein